MLSFGLLLLLYDIQKIESYMAMNMGSHAYNHVHCLVCKNSWKMLIC